MKSCTDFSSQTAALELADVFTSLHVLAGSNAILSVFDPSSLYCYIDFFSSVSPSIQFGNAKRC